MFKNMPDINKNKEVETYYEQIFKIACPNVDYDAVMQFFGLLKTNFKCKRKKLKKNKRLLHISQERTYFHRENIPIYQLYPWPVCTL